MTLDPDEGESASSTGNGAFETAAFHAKQWSEITRPSVGGGGRYGSSSNSSSPTTTSSPGSNPAR